MEFRNAYSPAASVRLDCPEPTLTQQHLKDEVDINVMLERFKVTGVMPVNVRLPQYGDFTGISDFRSAMDAVRSASDQFMSLPAAVRARFGNDPQQFLEFVSEPGHEAELRSMGLLPPEVVPRETPPSGSPAA